jgi:hypothetical protein
MVVIRLAEEFHVCHDKVISDYRNGAHLRLGITIYWCSALQDSELGPNFKEQVRRRSVIRQRCESLPQVGDSGQGGGEVSFGL